MCNGNSAVFAACGAPYSRKALAFDVRGYTHWCHCHLYVIYMHHAVCVFLLDADRVWTLWEAPSSSCMVVADIDAFHGNQPFFWLAASCHYISSRVCAGSRDKMVAKLCSVYHVSAVFSSTACVVVPCINLLVTLKALLWRRHFKARI